MGVVCWPDQHRHVPVAAPAQGALAGDSTAIESAVDSTAAADPLEQGGVGLRLAPAQGVELGAVLALVPEPVVA